MSHHDLNVIAIVDPYRTEYITDTWLLSGLGGSIAVACPNNDSHFLDPQRNDRCMSVLS